MLASLNRRVVARRIGIHPFTPSSGRHQLSMSIEVSYSNPRNSNPEEKKPQSPFSPFSLPFFSPSSSPTSSALSASSLFRRTEFSNLYDLHQCLLTAIYSDIIDIFFTVAQRHSSCVIGTRKKSFSFLFFRTYSPRSLGG